jgi:hypothetical protein
VDRGVKPTPENHKVEAFMDKLVTFLTKNVTIKAFQTVTTNTAQK